MSHSDRIRVQLLSTGYYRAQGSGPSEWAQWPVGEALSDAHFFPEASPHFRRTLTRLVTRRRSFKLALARLHARSEASS